MWDLDDLSAILIFGFVGIEYEFAAVHIIVLVLVNVVDFKGGVIDKTARGDEGVDGEDDEVHKALCFVGGEGRFHP